FSQPVIDGGVALASDFARAQQEADNFALSQAASVVTIHWWGAYANNDLRSDNFTVRFFTDVAGYSALVPFLDVSRPASCGRKPVYWTHSATGSMSTRPPSSARSRWTRPRPITCQW